MQRDFWIYTLNLILLLVICFCRIQPVYVVDVAGAVVSALKDDGSSMGKIYELGGPEVFTIHELVISLFILLQFLDLRMLAHFTECQAPCRRS